LQLIEKSASDAEVLEIIIHANEIMVKGDAKLIYARLIEGRFPNYKDVIPQSANSTVDLVTSTFFSAVRQSQILTNEETRGVDFTFSDGKLILSSKAADMGESTIELPITFEDKEVVIRFDPRYMTDYLRVLESGDNIQLKLITGDDPAIFRVSEDYTYVMMPLSR
jgi:DNA polymerase-3 subunit beta